MNAKVTVHENAEAPVPAIPEKETVTDSKGRVIVLRDLDPIQQSRLTLGVGAEAAANGPYMAAFVFPAAMVEQIDEDKYAPPTNRMQVEAMLQILGNHGLGAIVSHFEAKMKAAAAAAAAAAEDEAEKAAIKN